MSRKNRRAQGRSLQELAKELTKLRRALEKATQQFNKTSKTEETEDAIRMNLIRVHEAMAAVTKMEQDFWKMFCEGTDLDLKKIRHTLAHGHEITAGQLQRAMVEVVEPLRVAMQQTEIAKPYPKDGGWKVSLGGEAYKNWAAQVSEEDRLRSTFAVIMLTPADRFQVLRIGAHEDPETGLVTAMNVASSRAWSGYLSLTAVRGK